MENELPVRPASTTCYKQNLDAAMDPCKAGDPPDSTVDDASPVGLVSPTNGLYSYLCLGAHGGSCVRYGMTTCTCMGEYCEMPSLSLPHARAFVSLRNHELPPQ